MDEFQSGEETSFVVEEVSNIIKEAIESAIGGNAYQHSKVNQWTTSVVEQTLSQLTKLGKPFKYIVTCVIMQKNGAGLHTASSCFWDNTCDGNCTVRWENKTMYCIVSAFGLAI
ncbi:dynein light chain Tctex-type 1 [Chelydra serpentina]|uniref:Dynein light chain Tctex-type 1 n=2 Tax=Chelydra serpentina TaxID=8475 RepID=A0A8C3TFS4_CHESE|nr:dynein light chain Tctex-type 1 [Chelydra serpentina]